MGNLFKYGRKVFAILKNNEGGDEIIRDAPSLSDDQLQKKLDDFFHKAGGWRHYIDKETGGKPITEHKRKSKDYDLYGFNADEVLTPFVLNNEKAMSKVKSNLKEIVGSDELTAENIARYIVEKVKRQDEYIKMGFLEISKEKATKIASDILKEQESKREIKHDKIAVIYLGTAGSGKTSAGGKDILNKIGAYEIDADICKEKLPPFDTDKDAVGYVHEASSTITKIKQKMAMESGANLFIPKVGDNYDNLMKKTIQPLLDAGYKVYVGRVECEKDENVRRQIQRALTDGRFTKPDKFLTDEQFKGIDDTMNKILKNDKIEGTYIVDNTLYGNKKVKHSRNWITGANDI